MAFRKPSISYWNRVEPSPRSDSLVRGLEAAVRDPAWFLARQWEMGEFRGEDAASIATVSVIARSARFESWTPHGGAEQPIDLRTPLEARVEDEHTTPNWALAVELGQTLVRLLASAGANDATLGKFRDAYPTPRPSELTSAQRRDQELVRLLRVCGGRSLDGVKALAEAIVTAPAIPNTLSVPPGAESLAVESALAEFIDWARAVHGQIGVADAPAWQPERLDYDVQAVARTPEGKRANLRAITGAHGEFDWYAFDEIARLAPEGEGGEISGVEEDSYSLFPTAVSFSGMPHGRWWQFEDARFNWASVDTDRRELAKAMVLDFMLVQGNDWFLIPFPQKVGTLAAIRQLLVRDVFGDWTLVSHAEPESSRARWTLYSTTVAAAEGENVSPYLMLPPSTLRTTLDGPDLEEVRFIRDEQANLVWAIEARTENGAGRPWPGHERALTVEDKVPDPPPTEAPLRYRLQTGAPLHWIPFPPVQIDATRRAVALERAAMQRFIDGTLTRVEPVGRVLSPTNLDDPHVYRIREEEVSRSGVRVSRANKRSRWIDGSTHVWTSRQRRAASGEGASRLFYDLAERTGKGDPQP